MKRFSALIALFMTSQLLLAQGVSMQNFISKDKAVMVANFTPSATFNKLDTATTNHINLSKRLAPMLMAMTGADMSASNIESVEKKLADSEATGLDMQKEVYVWLQNPAQPDSELYAGSSNPYTANIIIPVTDVSKLQAFMKELFGDDKMSAVVSNNGINSLIHNRTLLNWTKERLIVSRSLIQQSFFDEDNEYNNKINAILGMHAEALGTLQKSASIHSDANYQKHLHKDSDMDFWMDYQSFGMDYNAIPPQARALVKSIVDFGSNMKIGANGFLKNGEAQMLMETYMGAELSRIIASTYDLKVNKDFFKYINKDELIGMYMMAINLKGFISSYGTELYKVLDQSKEGAIVKNLLDIVDIFVDEEEIYSILKGDMMLAMTGVEVFERATIDYEYNEDSDQWEEVKKNKKDALPKAAMMMSYGSEENIMKFVQLASNAGVISKKEEGVWLVGGVKEQMGFDVFIVVKEGIFMVTNDAAIIKNISAGVAKSKQLDPKLVKEITEYIQYAKFDFKQMMDAVQESSKDLGIELPAQMDNMDKVFDYFEMKSSKPNGNESISEMRLVLKDKNTNVMDSMMNVVRDVMQVMLSGGMNATPEDDGTKKL